MSMNGVVRKLRMRRKRKYRGRSILLRCLWEPQLRKMKRKLVIWRWEVSLIWISCSKLNHTNNLHPELPPPNKQSLSPPPPHSRTISTPSLPPAHHHTLLPSLKKHPSPSPFPQP